MQKLKKVITHQSYRSVQTPVAEGRSLKTPECYWTAESVQQL